MSPLKFLDTILIDVDHTLQQLLSRFQSVNHGLPELIKNSKDQYSRLGVTDKEKRVIVVVASPRLKKLAVVDFAGASKEDFRHWMKWSDRNAGRADLGTDIEAGHGNGGKAFLVRGSASIAFMESCLNGRRTKMGFQNDDHRHHYYPGYFIEGGQEINDCECNDVETQAKKTLGEFGLAVGDLPVPAQRMLRERRSYTIAGLADVSEWMGRREPSIRRFVGEIPSRLKIHAQAALAIETCSIWVVVSGQISATDPLVREYPEPMQGLDNLPNIPVPDDLTDPTTREAISTGPGDANTRFLALHTSCKSLRMEGTKPLNVIRVRNNRNIVASWSIADLAPRPESAFIYGEIRVPGLTEDHLAGADRTEMADTPLVRALRAWVIDQIAELASRIQRETARSHKPEDCNSVNVGLEKLRDLMREFLGDIDNGGTDGGGRGLDGEGRDGGQGTRTRQPGVFGSTIHEIILEGGASSLALAVGTQVPLVVRAYERSSDGDRLPIKDASLVFHSDMEGALEFTADGLLKSNRASSGCIWFTDEGMSAESNRLYVESVECRRVTIDNIPDRLLLQGERIRLTPVFDTASGPRRDLLVEASVDEPDMGRINRHAVFTAGHQEGSATARLRFGYAADSFATCSLDIGDEKVPLQDRGGQEGGELPLILLCGTEVPNMEQFPSDQRTIFPSIHYPTIIDSQPPFEHVIFVNPDSAESFQMRKDRGGRTGTAGIRNETFMQFLSLKCFDILKRLWVRQSMKGRTLTELQLRNEFAMAEMECAPFIERAFTVAEGLAEVWRNEQRS